MFEIEKIDTFNVIEMIDDETKLETILYIEGDKNKLLENENAISFENSVIDYEDNGLFINLIKHHKKSYKNQSDLIAASIYSHLASIKDILHSINVFSEDEVIYVDRFFKGSGKSIQKFAFHPNDLLEISYSNLSKGKTFFIFKFTEHRAIFMNREKLEFMKGEKHLTKFGEFRFIDSPLRKVF